jgi:Tfp pilus assembly protein PilP
MISAPNGKTYVVSERTKIGTRKGIVLKVQPDAILIREKVVNVLGQEENVDVEIRMP